MTASIPPPAAATGLAMALVRSSTAPVLLLDGDLKIVGLSASFSQTFDLDTAEVQGREIFKLGDGEWNIPQLRSLLDASVRGDAEIDAYELEMATSGGKRRRLVLNARNLSYGDAEHLRLMLTITDVTDLRIAERLQDTLVHDKGVLLQELQHRVANSLQIIASVIMQTARKSRSDEARLSLADAHNRLMSVAELQKLLSASNVGEVNLRSYFSNLCASIGASMIRDPDRVTIEVDADDSFFTADASVSLGLIVTELVINSLKHAFPKNHRGRIIVHYRSTGPDWTLSVNDDGIGLPAAPDQVTPGLGTSIIRALAQQLGATIEVVSATPGASVIVQHGEAVSGTRTVQEPLPAV